MSDWPNGLHVLIQTTGWDEAKQADGPLGHVAVSIMLPVSGTEGKWFTCTTTDPVILWDLLVNLDQNRENALKAYFGYSAPLPPKPRSADELLSQLL